MAMNWSIVSVDSEKGNVIKRAETIFLYVQSQQPYLQRWNAYQNKMLHKNEFQNLSEKINLFR